jgi:Methyltransferase domain/Tetratricopeptide repeat
MRISNRVRERPVTLAQAEHAVAAGNLHLAVQLYRKFLKESPQNAVAWIKYGDLLQICGDSAQAEEAYRTAVVREPGRAESFQKLGDILRLQGKDKDANAAYLVAVALDPSAIYSGDRSSAFGWSEPQIATLRAMLAPPSARDDKMADAIYEGLDWLASGQPATEDPQFCVSVSQFTAFDQKLFLSCSYKNEHQRVRLIFVVFSSHIFVHMADPEARHLGEYNAIIKIPHGATHQMKLGFEFEDGSRFIIESPINGEASGESGRKIFPRFTELVRSTRHSNFLELGSRTGRTGFQYKTFFVPEDCNYVGLDIKEGDNVDVVGDAHFLSAHFPKNHFDFVFSIAVFEHIMMPWKVAIELNRVMKIGAIGFVSSHQSFPLHEQPWDFWRFSDMGWHAIFNRVTGFEVIESGLEERARIVPVNFNSITYGMDAGPAYLGSNVLFRKVAESIADWPVEPADLMKTAYPY